MGQTPDNNQLGAQEEHHTHVLENFSFAQVIASALSAVTSVLLSQQIGLIGGLLGVAAGAAAATIATQLYRGMLDASAERLKEHVAPVAEGLTVRMASSSQDDETTQLDGTHLRADETDATDETLVVTRPQGIEGENVPKMRIASDTLLMRRVEQDRRAKLRMTAVVAAVSLATVALVALAIHIATAGEGLGERVVIVQPPAAEEQVAEEAADETEAESDPEAVTDASIDASTEDASDQQQPSDGTAVETDQADGGQETMTTQPAVEPTTTDQQPTSDGTVSPETTAAQDGTDAQAADSSTDSTQPQS